MNRNSLTTAVIAGIAGVAGIANMANAVNLNPDGLGQVLLYPYYTVHNGQQTLLSVVNTAGVGKAVKVRFLEGHNSREVLDFNLFLSKFDVWTATVFALADGGVGTAGAGIFTTDNSCTAPAFPESGGSVPAKYQHFLNYFYIGQYTDSGPTTIDRTEEGHFEMIAMGDILVPSALNTDITHVNSVPPGCAKAETDFEVGNFSNIVPPTTGLFGSAAVVKVSQGTYYAYNADALDGFTAKTLGTTTGNLTPNLTFVNDAPAGSTTATSYVFNDGLLLTSVYPAATQAIDAVSSVFAAANLYNQYQSAANGSIGSDWVVNFPTKRFYVDPLAIQNFTTPIQPFEETFGGGLNNAGTAYLDPDNSCVIVSAVIYDREENTSSTPGCTFSPCPPGQPPSSICKETNVISFLANGTQADILASTLRQNLAPVGSAGWLNLGLNSTSGPIQTRGGAHTFRASTNGNVFHGLPVTGFEAENFVNGSGGGAGVLANYSGVYRHRQSRNCTNAAGVGGACS